MTLEQNQTYDVEALPNGRLVLTLRGTPAWGGKAVFLRKNPDGSLTVSAIIEEDGPSCAATAARALSAETLTRVRE